MANKEHLQLARGTSEEWAAKTTALWPGEVGIDTTNHRIKVGDGETLWKDLPYCDRGDELYEILMELTQSLSTIDGGYADGLDEEYAGSKVGKLPGNNGSLPDDGDENTEDDGIYYEDV